MILEGFGKVEGYNFYLDVAFRRARDAAAKQRRKKKTKDRLASAKDAEQTRFTVVEQTIAGYLDKILKAFPSLDGLTPFYQELVRCTMDYVAVKKSLASLKWAKERAHDFLRIYQGQVRRAPGIDQLKRIRGEYYGRISSLLKQIRSSFEFIEEARKILRDFPSIKSGLYSVCIFGFPNVGKTTLLSRITPSMPEIAAYPFTTKSLNLGYLPDGHRKIQIIDTPGTLNRFNRMNNIEKQAYLAVEHVADLVVFVFDMMGEYSLPTQKKLYTRVKKMSKPVIVFLGKADILDDARKNEFTGHFPDAITDPDELVKKLLELSNISRDNLALAR